MIESASLRYRLNTTSSVGVSVFIHLLFALFVFLWAKFIPLKTIAHNPAQIQIEYIDTPKKKETASKSQVVETEILESAKEAPEDAYLSEKNHKIKKQTRASITAPFQNLKQSNRVGSASPLSPSLSHLGVQLDWKPLGGRQSMNNSNQTPQDSSSNDYLKNIENGAQTLLNTKEYAYFSFYQRVRRQLEQFWEPRLREKVRFMMNRGRMLASDREHSTKLLVVLDQKGTITQVQVEDTSGVSDLDDAAIEAFNRAGPFPNPPKGLVEKDGKVKVEWEFILKT